jgi:microcystin-dependent protein
MLGEIRMVGFNFAPRGWAMCNGQILSIAQNTALFSLLGTTYGGNGQTTFALPDFRGRVPVHQGQGPGLSPQSIGEQAGTETVTLLQTQMPAHNHVVRGNNTLNTTNRVDGAFPAVRGMYAKQDDANMNPAMIQPAGGSQPHENLQPYLVVTFIIALEGIFPSRN